MIGRFSVLSCANVANITSYYNGTKYSYLMYKNNGGINIDKVAEEKGDYKNGLEVSAEIPDMSADVFRDALYSLAMFKNLYVENNVIKFSNICNQFNQRKVARKNNLLVCNILSNDTYFKVGNVLYPAKYKNGLTTSGIIIELPMGQVDITPNREELQYSQFTNNTIYSAANLVLKTFKDLIQAKMKVASLQDYYMFCDGYNFNIQIDDVQFGVRSTDYMNIDFDITIDGNVIPDGFAKFFNDIRYIYAEPEYIYKILSTGRRYRNSMSLRSLLRDEDYYAIKGDSVTKQVTLSYYRDNLDKDTVIFTQTGLQSYKQDISKRLHSIPREYNIDECLDFLFNHIKVKKILNSEVPSSYIKEFKDRLKPITDANNKRLFSIRRYSEYGFRNIDYTEFNSFLRFECPTFTVYDSNTTEHTVLKDIASLFSGYKITKNSRNVYPNVITVKKSDIEILKNRKKFVHISDFLYLRNNFLEKIVTAYIIAKHFDGVVSYHLLRCKKYMEFRTKYYRQLSAISSLVNNKTLEGIVEYYVKRKWYNKADIDYYRVSDDDVKILEEIDLMSSYKDEVLNAIYYRLYGRNKLLSIAKPKNKNVYEIIKRL